MSVWHLPGNNPRRPIAAMPDHALLRIVTEHAGVGLVIVSPERRYLYANRTYAEILDLPQPELVGQRVPEVLAAVYDDQIRPRLDRAFAGERIGYDLRMSGPDGDRLYAVRYEPTQIDGTGPCVIVVITEVTGSRRSDIDARRLAAIVESSDDAIVSKDLDGVVTSWNAGATRLFGYSAEEMIGSPITKLIPEDRLDEEADILARIRRNERVSSFETVRQTSTGRRIDVSLTTSPIRDAEGRVIGASKVARDITARKRAEAERRFQQAMLLTERELTLDGILVVDDRSTVLSYNGRFAEMWGLGTDVLATRADRTLLQVVRDRLVDPDGFMRRIRELYERHDETSHDEVALTDGRTFHRYSAPMRDPDGRYYGRVWYFRDVTESRRAEAALRSERDRAQRYLDTAEAILLALSPEGRVTLINRKGCEVLGWTEADLLGRDWVETCVPARIRPALRQKFERLVAGDTSVVENPVLTHGGEERLIEWRNRVLRDEDGRISGTLSSGIDITEQHEAAEALRAAEQRMRFALESANVGIWDHDYATGVARMSPIAEAHFGLATGTFSGDFESFTGAVHPDDRQLLLDTVERAKLSGRDFSAQFRVLWPDGSIRWLTTVGRIHTDAGGQPERAVGVSLDVTDRRSLEAQYHQAQKMEAVGRLAGGVAHDFNNLLTAILGYCQLLLADLDAHDPRAADIQAIHRAGESAAGLTRQLLAFSRKQIIEPTVLDLNDVIGGLRRILGRVIGEDVTVTLHPGANLGSIKADRAQMEQVVLNLAVNARDAMRDGGSLTIATANVELDEGYADRHFRVRPGHYVVLRVSDTGVGMSPEVQARLFEPFFTTKPVGQGTGLGLATVHGIVTRANGSITVYSELGHGTTFNVYLPQLADAEAVAESRPAPSRITGAGETVLVVEDAEHLRTLVRRMLERQGYHVILAENVMEATARLDDTPNVDVILTDVVMPDGSGPDLIKRIAGRHPATKVVYMSGYTEDVITHHGVLAPGLAFLHKPFTSETLGRKIREVLDR